MKTTMEQHMNESWNGVKAIFQNYSKTEQELFKTIFEYGFRRGEYLGESFILNGGNLDDSSN